MRLLTLLLLPAALLGGQPRYARLGEFQGQVEVQLTAADPWIPAERNLPLTESAWIRTGPGAHLEIELDDGSDWRLGPDSLGELSDYSRLSTGQRVTLLSLDHGIAYFSGQPKGRDVTMVVVPGAQMTVLQGSRVRTVAQAGWSQVAMLEGRVRFSSPSAEMEIHEGTTARVEPATPSHFFLYPEVTVEAMDRWSEDRDRAHTAPASAAHVNARYGVSDLDAAGKWISTPDLGQVWQPEVAADWAPYQKGRWRYFEDSGYTWVSDDAWGWLPYHNGRWVKKEKLGWVWQPAVSAVFHPGEVYWVRGATFTGWGPLAPGEISAAASPGVAAPQAYTAGAITYASFQPDVRTIDPNGFAAPTAEQLKTLTFVPALPSPAFLVSRLDATRPVLKAGSTRIVPSVPGVTLGDSPPIEPPSDYMTNPPENTPPPANGDASAGATPPPDGVYPVPVAAVPVIEWPVIINPPVHPDFARRPGNASGGNPNTPGTKPGQTTPPASSPTPSVSAAATPPNSPTQSASASNTPGNQPVRQHPPSSGPSSAPPATPVPPASQPVREHPVAAPAPSAPKLDAPKVDAGKLMKAGMLPGELEVYRQVLQDVNPPSPNYAKALIDLNTWSNKFPNTAYQNDRLYYYVHVYNGMARSDKVLDTAGILVSAGVSYLYPDQQQVLQILVAASSSVQKLPKPTAEQLATGQKAARQLLEFLPDYFSPRHKPEGVSDNDWALGRAQLENVARQALGKKSMALTASK